MIRDPSVLASIRASWEFVRHSRNVAVGNCNAATWVVGFNQTGMRDLCFNLILASAYSVLEEVLQALRDESVFACKSSKLGQLLVASKSVLPWQNWQLIDEGRDKRNQSVHDKGYMAHAEGRNYIAALEQELLTFKVLPKATPELWHW